MASGPDAAGAAGIAEPEDEGNDAPAELADARRDARERKGCIECGTQACGRVRPYAVPPSPMGGEVLLCDPCARCLAELADLVAEGRVCLAGQGRHPDGGWPPEPSLLVLGLDRVAASELGRRWDQNAVVWVGEDATPELVLLR